MDIAIAEIAYYLPAKIETSLTLVRDNPDWRIADIEEKTGISNRYIAGPEESALDLAEQAGRQLLNGPNGQDIDGLIYISQSPEYPLPSTACLLQERLGLPITTMAFDLNLGCSGYIHGLAVAGSLLTNNIASKVLLVCSDTYSKYISRDNRTCRPIFSDGAAATILTRTGDGGLGPFSFATDGAGAESLLVKPGPQSCSYCGQSPVELTMNGPQVFLFTMAQVPKSVNQVLTKAKISIDDIDLFIFHQASKLVIDNLIRHLHLPKDKVYRNYQRVGNTVSASIPIALKDAEEEGRLRPGSKVLLSGFGVGLSIGSVLLEW